MAVHGGNSDGIAQTQIIEFIKLRRNLSRRIAFVDAEHHRLAAFLQHYRHIRIVGGNSRPQISHQDDDVRLFNRQLSLTAHLRKDHIIGAGLDAAGIRQHELPPAPLTLGKDPVPGHPRRILDDGQPLSDQLVEKGGLAHIGPPDHRYYRPRHCAHRLFY